MQPIRMHEMLQNMFHGTRSDVVLLNLVVPLLNKRQMPHLTKVKRLQPIQHHLHQPFADMLKCGAAAARNQKVLFHNTHVCGLPTLQLGKTQEGLHIVLGVLSTVIKLLAALFSSTLLTNCTRNSVGTKICNFSKGTPLESCFCVEALQRFPTRGLRFSQI